MDTSIAQHHRKLLLRLLLLAGLAVLMLLTIGSIDGQVRIASAGCEGFASSCNGHSSPHYFEERDCGRNPYKYNDVSGEWERLFAQWCSLENHDAFEVIFDKMTYSQADTALNSVGLGVLSHDEQLQGLIRLGYWRAEGYGPGEARPRRFVIPDNRITGSPVTVVGSTVVSSSTTTTTSSTSSTSTAESTSTSSTTTTTAPVTPTDLPADGQYTVQGGDTIWGIATRFGINPYALIAANPDIDPGVIVPGQVINLPTE